MSPEQAGAASAPVDHRTDVYCLGRDALRAADAAARPFDGSDAAGRAACRSSSAEPVPPRQLDPAVPRDLETIVLKAMAKRPERPLRDGPRAGRRPAAVPRRRAGHGPPHRPAGPGGPLARRNPALAAMVALVWLSLSGHLRLDAVRPGADGDRRKADGRAEAEAEARREAAGNLYVAQANVAAAAWGDGEDDRARTLLDRIRPAAGQADRRGWEWRFLDRKLNGGFHAPLKYLNDTADASRDYPTLSSDGRRIVLHPSLGRDVAWEVFDATAAGRPAPAQVHRRPPFRDDAKAAACARGTT